VRIGILASGAGWHAADLLRAAEKLDLAALRVEPTRLAGAVGGERYAPECDRLIVRTMPRGTLEQVIFRMDVLQRLEADGLPVINSPRALEVAIDKYLASARLEAAGLPVPETFVAEDPARALEAFERLGGDVVLKPLFGSEGRGIERFTALGEARERFESAAAAGSVLYLQRFIRHPGHDYRVLVIGGRAVCGMRRTAATGWITNVARGGRPEPLEVSRPLEDLAVRAAQSLGAEIAGVDILPDAAGDLWVLEVNAVPGWRALAPTSGVDVAREVIRYAAQKEAACKVCSREENPSVSAG
jgi:ribosomal protein S6--L-glutamate ligase